MQLNKMKKNLYSFDILIYFQLLLKNLSIKFKKKNEFTSLSLLQ